MTKLAKGFGFDLANAFAGDSKGLADFFESVLAAIVEAETHLDDFFLARRQGLQHRGSLFLEVEVDNGIGGRDDGLVLDEIAEVRVFFLADRSFERNRLLGNLQNLAHFGDRDVHALGNFFAGGFATEFLNKLATGANQFVDGFNHVNRDADGACLVGNGAGDGLANPPSSVGGKFVAATPFELVDGLHQADIAFLNEIEELQTAVGVFLRDGDDQAKVGLDQFLLGLFGFRFAALNDGEGALQLGEADFTGFLNVLQFGTTGTQFAAGFGGVFALGN